MIDSWQQLEKATSLSFGIQMMVLLYTQGFLKQHQCSSLGGTCLLIKIQSILHTFWSLVFITKSRSTHWTLTLDQCSILLKKEHVNFQIQVLFEIILSLLSMETCWWQEQQEERSVCFQFTAKYIELQCLYQATVYFQLLFKMTKFMLEEEMAKFEKFQQLVENGTWHMKHNLTVKWLHLP